MGEPNNVLNVYMNKEDRLRSVLEYYLGEKLPQEWTFGEWNGFYAVRNAKGKMSFRQRDGIKRVCTGKSCFFLGWENQETVNLTFPWRMMELDCLAYGAGIEKIQERNQKNKPAYRAEDDFKYHYRKEDRLEPLLNLTLYWGKKKWTGPLCLGDMMEMDTLTEKLRGLFADYRVNLVPMRQIPEAALEEMDSDLKYVLGLMKRTRSKRKYEEYILQNREYFSRIPKSAVDVLDVCTGLKDMRKYMEFTANGVDEEEADMCKALKGIIKDAEKQGMKQGETLLASLMSRLLSDGRMEDAKMAASDDVARQRLYREYGITETA